MTENELLQALAEELTLPAFDPEHEVTAGTLADETGTSVRQAVTKLSQLEKAGRLKSHWVRLPNNCRSRAYYKNEV